jgi:pyruvate kinase
MKNGHDPMHADHPPRPVPKPTRAKIIATLGPASERADVVRKLIEGGVSVFRLNFSHGDLASHLARLRCVRAVSASLGVPIAVMGDLCGPKIRVGEVPESEGSKGIELIRGQEVLFRAGVTRAEVHSGGSEASEHGRDARVVILPTTHPAMIDEINPGERVLLNDGAIRTLATERSLSASGARQLRCRVTQGGLVTTGKGINLPDSTLSLPAITQRDWECVEWAVEQGLDFLALSFVRDAADVRLLKQRLTERAGESDPIPVVAKIEKPQAVENLLAIVDAADAAMVARGDLGVEMDIARVPGVQRRILRACADRGRPCIVATQMLETMIESASPTRAEASDVGHAVFDGAGCVMLSGETAVGKHPALVVETMRRIVAASEEAQDAEHAADSAPSAWVASGYGTAALAHGAWQIARDIGARLIVCWSQCGGTARYLSQQSFRVPIVAYTSSAVNARRMALLKDVTPILKQPPPSGGLGDFTDIVEHDMLARGWIAKGEMVLLLAGKPLGTAKATNSIATFRIGDPTGGYRAHRS